MREQRPGSRDAERRGSERVLGAVSSRVECHTRFHFPVHMLPSDGPAEFEALLEFLKQDRGFDFTGYKRASLQRRVQKRMDAVQQTSYAGYLAYLTATPDEFGQLFDTLLINVTRFFRDEMPWTTLATEVLPALLARRASGSPLRIWSAGCATGEEAYTLAIMLAELLGIEAYRERVKIYATDVDDEALNVARAAVYTERQMADVPEAMRDKYFDRLDSRYLFRKELRRSVIFGRNDLVQDAPISRVDLLVCRNTLMYFDSPTQAGVMSRFHFALAEDGVMMLGRAETLLMQTNAFTPIDLKGRIFLKVPRTALRDRLLPLALRGREREESVQGSLRDAAFEASAEGQLVIDRSGLLVLANERARLMFGLVPSDMGRPLQDLEVSYRPVELRSLIEQCYDERRVVVLRDVSWRPRHVPESRWLDIEVTPLADTGGAVVGVSVALMDMTEQRRLHHELEDAKQNLETAYEELQSTNEELETTNEELQSTVEELETTNEELQSTNEELETMNEELHSTNGELQTVNDEIRRRGEELHELNDFLGAVFTSMRGGVVVLDRELRVLVWNAHAEELWGVRAGEVLGTGFLGLDIGLPVDAVATPIRSCLLGSQNGVPIRLPAVNRRGRAISVEVACTPLSSVDKAVRGVIVTMEEVA